MGIFCFISKNRNTHVTYRFFNVFFFLFNVDKIHALRDDFNSEIRQLFYTIFIVQPNKISLSTKDDISTIIFFREELTHE